MDALAYYARADGAVPKKKKQRRKLAAEMVARAIANSDELAAIPIFDLSSLSIKSKFVGAHLIDLMLPHSTSALDRAAFTTGIVCEKESVVVSRPSAAAAKRRAHRRDVGGDGRDRSNSFGVLPSPRSRPVPVPRVLTLLLASNPQLGPSGVHDLGCVLRSCSHTRIVDMRHVNADHESMRGFAARLLANISIEQLLFGESDKRSMVYEATGMLSPRRCDKKLAALTGDEAATIRVSAEDTEQAAAASSDTRRVIEFVTQQNRRINDYRDGKHTELVLTSRAHCTPVFRTISIDLVLAHTTKIDLSGNNMVKIEPAIFIQAGAALRDFTANHNRLVALPDTLGNCRELRVLRVSHNRLRTLPSTIERLARTLRMLDVSHNEIEQFPPNIIHLQSLSEFRAHHNRIEYAPANLVAAGGDALMQWIRYSQRHMTSVMRGKVMVVGGARTGKSALVAALRDGTKARAATGSRIGGAADEQLSTIRRHTWVTSGERRNARRGENRAPITLSVWDYCGRYSHHWAHQIFLAEERNSPTSSSSVFLVVFRLDEAHEHCARGTTDADLDYWMQAISGRDMLSETPIVLVGTHADVLTRRGVTDRQLSSVFQHTAKRYLDQCTNIVRCVAVSSVTQTMIDDLRQCIYTVALGQMDHFKRIPEWYVSFSEFIVTATDSGTLRPLVYFDAFFAMCRAQREIETAAEVEGFVRYLQSIGGALYFPEMRDAPIILNPEWLANVFGTLYHSAIVADTHAHLDADDLHRAWPGADAADADADDGVYRAGPDDGRLVSRDMLPHVRQILLRFNVLVPCAFAAPPTSDGECAATPRGTSFLLPDRLPEQPTAISIDDLDVGFWSRVPIERSAHRIYQFVYTPFGVFKHVLSHILRIRTLTMQHVWRHGIFMAVDGDAGALMLYMLPAKRQLVLRVMHKSEAGGHVKLLYKIESALDTLFHESLQVDFMLLVPCPDGEQRYAAKCVALDERFEASDDAAADNARYDDERFAIELAARHSFTHIQVAKAIAAEFTAIACPSCRGAIPLADLMPELSVERLSSDMLIIAPGDIEIVDRLGDGAYGVVEKAIYRDRIVAVKRLFVPGEADAMSALMHTSSSATATSRTIKGNTLKEFMTEVWFMKQMQNHPNLVNLVGVIKRPLSMVLEYMNMGSLHSFLFESATAASSAASSASSDSSHGSGSSPLGSVRQRAGSGAALPSLLPVSVSTSNIAPSPSMASLAGHRSKLSGGTAAREATLSRMMSSPALMSSPTAVGREQFQQQLKQPVVLLRESEQVTIALGVARGLHYLHEHDLVHRDLKSPNVLLHRDATSGELVAKVADFGLSVSTSFVDRLTVSRVDNPYWLAPEVMSVNAADPTNRRYNKESDVYSLGVILYEICYRRPFFEEVKFDTQVIQLVQQGRRPETPPTVGIRGELVALIADCWAQQAEHRPTSGEVVARLCSIKEQVRWQFDSTFGGEAYDELYHGYDDAHYAEEEAQSSTPAVDAAYYAEEAQSSTAIFDDTYYAEEAQSSSAPTVGAAYYADEEQSSTAIFDDAYYVEEEAAVDEAPVAAPSDAQWF